MGFKEKKKRHLRQEVERVRNMLSQGYVYDRYGKLVHRKVCRQAHGPFPRDWVVHHIDGIKSNNEPENLIALPRHLHDSLHSTMRRMKRQLTRIELQQALNCWKKLRHSKEVRITIILESKEA